MFILILILLAVIIFVVLVKFPQYRPKWIQIKSSNSSIRILIPLSEKADFKQEAFQNTYQETWGNKVFCEPINNDDRDEVYDNNYILTDSLHRNMILLKYSSKPLDSEITKMLANAGKKGFTDNKPITNEDTQALQNHQAFIELECNIGQREAIDSLDFTANTLLSVFKVLPAIGYANTIAQSYKPLVRIKEFESRTTLQRADLFLLFVNIQIVSDNTYTDIHTHGMDQFKLPDLQIVFDEKTETNYHYNVLRSAAVYIIENGNILKLGNTWQLSGDNTIFEVVLYKNDKQHFGYNRVISLERTIALKKG